QQEEEGSGRVSIKIPKRGRIVNIDDDDDEGDEDREPLRKKTTRSRALLSGGKGDATVVAKEDTQVPASITCCSANPA
ncbi:hypothetical protein A2U01_0095709, partial [Trifolium medium]|nr:hypothetical protein [Trifolium medium]